MTLIVLRQTIEWVLVLLLVQSENCSVMFWKVIAAHLNWLKLTICDATNKNMKCV